jgi:DNA polymerase-3 subunit gamma/tau
MSAAQPRTTMPQGAPHGAPTAMARAQVQPDVQIAAAPQVEIRSFADIIELAQTHGEAVLRAELMRAIHLVSFQPGHIEVRLTEGAPRDLPNRISRFLGNVTGARWLVEVAQSGGADTVGEQMDAQARSKREDVKRHPLVQSILEAFPGAELEQVKQIGPVALPAAFAAPAPGLRPDAEPGDDDYGDVDPDGDLDL